MNHNANIPLKWSRVQRLTELIDAQTKERDELLTAIAEKSCPFKAGDVVYTDKGLGLNGLQVESVSYVSDWEQGQDNIWALNTFAYTKAGILSRRAVMVTMADDPRLTKEK